MAVDPGITAENDSFKRDAPPYPYGFNTGEIKAANAETEKSLSVWNGWLIENEGEQWICVTADGGGLEWTEDSADALCFSREEDAFDFITLLPRLGIVLADGAKGATEHIWWDDGQHAALSPHEPDENAVVLKEHDAAEAYALEHNRPIGG